MDVRGELRRDLKDRDSALLSRAVHAGGWSLFAGVGMGLAAGFMAGWGAGLTTFFGVFLGGILVALGVSEVAGKATSHMTDPSVGIRPKGLSKAQALAAGGRVDEAAAELERVVGGRPDDLEAYLLLARLVRDELEDPEAAARWFRLARDRATLHEGSERLLYLELVETLRRIEPRRAAPELARMAERFEGTPDGEWARAELAELKSSMERD